MNGTLDQNETVRYHFQIPVAGITVRVCISVGHVVVYGSFSVPNPNSAFYDFLLEFESETSNSESENCQSTFIDPDKIPPSPSSPNIQSSSTHAPSSDSRPPTTSLAPQPTVVPNDIDLTDRVVFLSVVGGAGENNFVLNGSVGDTYPTPPDAIQTTTIPTIPTTTTTVVHTIPTTTTTAPDSSKRGSMYCLVPSISICTMYHLASSRSTCICTGPLSEFCTDGYLCVILQLTEGGCSS